MNRMSPAPFPGPIVDKSLDDYLRFCDEVARGSLAPPPPRELELIRDVDALIREVWVESVGAQPIPSFVSLNAYYSFLAAVRCAISGQVSVIFPLFRSALESACYGLLVAKDPGLLRVWLDREKGRAELAACRRAFTPGVKTVADRFQAEQPQMAEYIRECYEASLSFGGHPNLMSVIPHLTVSDEGAQWRVSFAAIYGEGSFEIQRALMACADYGLVVAFLTAHSLESHKDPAALNLRFAAVNERKLKVEKELQAETVGEGPGAAERGSPGGTATEPQPE
jgi:hypothetical protein